MNNDLKLVKFLLPDYNCEEEKPGAIRCRAKYDEGFNNENGWEKFKENIRFWFGERFKEIYHEVNFHHQDFYIYYSSPTEIGQQGVEEAAYESAIEEGYPQSDKTQFTTTYWTQHNIYVDGFKAGVNYASQPTPPQEGQFVWTDELVKNYAEQYRFSSSRTSIETFKKTGIYNQESVNRNYNAAMEEGQDELWDEVHDAINGVCYEGVSNSEVNQLIKTLSRKYKLIKL